MILDLVVGLAVLVVIFLPGELFVAAVDWRDQQTWLGPMTRAACEQLQQDASQGEPETRIRCVPVPDTLIHGGGAYGQLHTAAAPAAISAASAHRPGDPS